MTANRLVVTLLLLWLGLAVRLPAQQNGGPKKFEAIKAMAEQGNAEAQYNLGICYHEGEGVAKDVFEAVKWFRKAAEQGYPTAQSALGWCFLRQRRRPSRGRSGGREVVA